MRGPTNARRGVTLTELLVVMLIISLLSTVAIPVYINRMEDARIRLAQAESREIAQAEEQVALIHGFYVPFQVLDDVPRRQGFALSGEDFIGNEPGTIYLVNPTIRPESQMGTGQEVMQLTSTNPRVRNLIENWSGPFLNPQRVYIGTSQWGPGDPQYPNNPWFQMDYPLDPWGEPYRFYSPIGIIGSGAYSLNQPYQNTTADGLLTTVDDRNFERYAVVSWGRNGLPNEGSLADITVQDDIVHFFGTPGVESTFGLR